MDIDKDIFNLIEEQANIYKDKLAIIDDNINVKLTYSELEKKSYEYGNYLLNMGLKKGDKVIIFVQMNVYLYEIMISLFRNGIIAVFVDPHAGFKYVDMCCELVKPNAVIAKNIHMFYLCLSKSIRNIKKKITVESMIKNKVNCETRIPVNETRENFINTDALITFTSGTTGIPKVIVRTQKFLIDQHKIIDTLISDANNTVIMTSLPIFLLSHLASGMTCVIPRGKWRQPKDIKLRLILEQILEHNCETIVSSPILIEKLLYNVNDDIKIMLEKSKLKYIYMGGSPVFPSKIEYYKENYKNIGITIIYGSSEAEPISECKINNISDDKIKLMRDGKGLYVGSFSEGIEYKLISIDDETVLNKGYGELIVSGDHVLKGYLNGIGDSENKLDMDGIKWHKTGDVGYIDDNNEFWLLGKKKGIINKNENIIFPFSIEAQLYYDRRIDKNAIIMIDNKSYIAIKINKNYKNEKNKIKSELEQKYHDFIVIFLNDIPTEKRHSSKIDYDKLKQIITSKRL